MTIFKIIKRKFSLDKTSTTKSVFFPWADTGDLIIGKVCQAQRSKDWVFVSGDGDRVVEKIFTVLKVVPLHSEYNTINKIYTIEQSKPILINFSFTTYVKIS